MTISEMLGQSAVLTLLGMCVVFAFLVVLICCMNLLRIFIHATGRDVEPKASENPVPVQAAQPAEDKGKIVAAIAVALHERG